MHENNFYNFDISCTYTSYSLIIFHKIKACKIICVILYYNSKPLSTILQQHFKENFAEFMNNISSRYLIYYIKNFFVCFLKFFGYTFRLIVFENYSVDRRRCDYRRFVFKKNSRCHKILLSDFYLYYAKPPLLKATVYSLKISDNDLFKRASE